MFHDEMIRYYDFLGLEKCKQRHLQSYYSETDGYRRLCSYYMASHDRFIPETPMDRPAVIPSEWYRYAKTDVDNNTKMSAVKTGINRWVAWETETKELYERIVKELHYMGNIADAYFVTGFVIDVNDELHEAKKTLADLKAANYDLAVVINS